MSQKFKPSKLSADVIILSYFGIGFFPYAPGTVASLLTIPLLYALSYLKISSFFIIPFFISFFVICCFLAHKAQREHKCLDPSWIVIDEFLGMICAWIISPNYNPLNFLLLFILFRFFDIVKPWPISFVDKKIKNGFGVIFDDIIAGVFAGVICKVISIYL